MSEHPTPQFPYRDGDVTVLGPEVFASEDGAVVCWKGENYVRQEFTTLEVVRDDQTPGAIHELASAVRDLVSAIRLESADRAEPEPSDPAECSGEAGPCPEHGHHEDSLKQPTEATTLPLRGQIADVIREFPFANFGLDGVSYLLESTPDTQEWVPKLADAVLAVLDPHGDTGTSIERGHRCFLENHVARLHDAEEAVKRVRAESTRIRAVTRTWEPVADLIDAALDGTSQPREQRERPTHPDGTPYRYHEMAAEGWGFCDGCRMWSTATPERPHQCPETHMQGPIIGTARIALDVQPGLADGLTSEERSDRSVTLPVVEFQGADVLRLWGDAGEARMVLAGDKRARFTVDGAPWAYATSSAHPITVEPLGPGVEGGYVTLTLITRKTTVNGQEVGDV